MTELNKVASWKLVKLAMVLWFVCAKTVAQDDIVKPIETEPLEITRVIPSGKHVAAGQQIVFTFNRPVVPIGRMQRNQDEIPVTVSPALNCQWRWLDTTNLACQLDEDNKLQQATKYTLVMQPGIKAEDGATIGEVYEHSFTTPRPQVSHSWLKEWRHPGVPYIRLSFNQPVSKSSLEKAIKFTWQQAGASREQSINAEYLKEVHDQQSSPYWLVSPKHSLPLDTKISLKVMPGLKSLFGSELSNEHRTVLTFHTFPEFSFLGVTCWTNSDDSILINEENYQEIGKCNPSARVALTFSAPVANAEIKNQVLIEPDLARGRTDYDPWANRRDHSIVRHRHKQGEHYHVWLPERLKAADTYSINTQAVELDTIDTLLSWFFDVPATALKDRFGRPLQEPIELTFFTDHKPANFTLPYRTAVLEKQIDSDVPLHVTNLDNVNVDYRKLTPDGTLNTQSLDIAVDNEQNVSASIPMQVRQMLQDKSGVLYGRVTSDPPGVNKYNVLFATVTPYQLHVKAGHYNTLVWVTDLATGLPVANARVQLYIDKVHRLADDRKILDETNTDTSGQALLQGMRELDPQLDLFDWCGSRIVDDCDRLFVRVDHAGEMALMPLEWRFQVDTYRTSNYTVWPRQEKQYGHIHAWGTTAQGVYRAGSTIEYKFYLRDQNNNRYIPAPEGNYTLEILDPTGKAVHQVKDIKLSAFGSYSGEYNVPENAAVGWYQFQLKGDFTDQYSWQPMRVLVSDFTPASFKVTNSLNGELFQPGEQVEISTRATLHSGGAYSDAQARITATLKARRFSSSHPLAKGFRFDHNRHQGSNRVFYKIGAINDQGEALHNFTLNDKKIVYGRLRVESAVRDDRGKFIAANSTANYVGVDRLVGLKHTKWLYQEDQPAEINYIVVDQHGEPRADTKVNLSIQREHIKTARVKGAGNAYLNNYTTEWVAAGDCEGVSKNQPQVCRFTPQEPGSYRITATIKDTTGKTHSSQIHAWVVGKGRVLWRSKNDHSLQIIAEETEYKVNDKARYLVKNPYPGAKALVSIERYGVLKSWVQELPGSTPVIEFDIEKDFLPGFYLSVVVISPRVDAPPPEIGQVDLGKPAFKMGYLSVPVKDPYKQIEVSVATDAQVYKPRDTVKATIKARVKHRDKKEQIEIAVAVLDESVLDLIQGGKSYFDPYQGFYKLDGLDLRNYSLLTRLLGRQAFGKKGANTGGDGGADLSIRSLFKFVSYWNPSIKADKDGQAQIEFEVPDNLTGWRILAFAVTPTDRMGLGDSNFKVNRPTEVRPVMPNQVTEGDAFQAGFSVMNRTDKVRDITVTIAVSGNVKPVPPFSKTIQLAPYKRQTVYLPVNATRLPQSRDIGTGTIAFTVKANDSIDGDGIKHNVPVHKRRSLDTAASYGTTTDDSVSESLQFPQAIYADAGNVSVELSPSVLGNIDGAFRYMRDYPYACWEQKLSKGVMASHYQNLKAYLADDLKWPNSKTLAGDTLKQAANYQAPNGGMVYFLPRNQYVSPYLSAYTALAFSWLRDSGELVPDTVEANLHRYLQHLLRSDVMPTFYSRGMSSTVRAVALAALAKHDKISLNDLQRYREHVQYMSLFGKAHYLQAALQVDGGDEIAREVTEIILASSHQSGGKFSFNEVQDDDYVRILATPLRANCSVLSAFTEYAGNNNGGSLVADIPFRLVRNITQSRGNRDHWENTQENMFCLNGLIDYSRHYEQRKPDMQVSVAIDATEMGNTRFTDLRDEAVTLRRPINESDVGSKRQVSISRQGDGRLYYATRMSYAPLDEHANRVNAGITIRKEYSVEREDKWVLLDNSAEVKRGELIRVDIYLSAPTARHFVVVSDPVPGGLEPVNRDLATSSTVDADKGAFQAADQSWWYQFKDWRYYNSSRWSFYHKELRHNAVRFYSDYLPAGNYHLSYTAQAIAAGEFAKMPIHAEEMYDPDVFGKGLPGTLNVTD